MVGWRRVLVGIACLVACAATVVGDELRLAGYLSDHAVLQADRPITIRGWADAEAGVRVTLGEEAIRTQADAAGRWDVVFSPRPASGEPLTLRVTAGDDTIELADVLIGDVWLCAGQSNMNRSLAESLEADAAEAARAAGDPLVRYLVVPERGHRQPQPHFDAAWSIPDAESIGSMPAVPVYFAQALRRRVNRPLGIVVTAASGSRGEAWMRAEHLSRETRDQKLMAAVRKLDEYRALRRRNPEEAGSRQALFDEDDPYALTPRLYMKRAPGVLFNGMIHPLAGLRLRGLLWYQGESNAMWPDGYRGLLPDLIADWRDWFADESLPVGIVQLPGYAGGQTRHDEQPTWAIIREAQRLARRDVPHTGLIVTIDVGETMSAHPKNKRPVGDRAAQWAAANVYDQPGPGEGPLPIDARFHDGVIVVRFDHVADGMTVRDTGPTSSFEVATAGGWTAPASVLIERDHATITPPPGVVVTAVRYAWANDPQHNLIANSAGLLATPVLLTLDPP